MNAIGKNSRFRNRWDLVILVLIVLSCFAVPFQVAFRHRVDLVSSALIYLIDLVFVIDIFFNFRTTFRSKGVEITDRKLIAANYLRGMFVLDLLAAFPFDALFLALRDVEIYGISIVLLLRSVRLLRVVRLLVLFREWERASWTNSGYLRIVKLLVVALLFVHLIACAWFLVPFVEGFPQDSWVSLSALVDADPTTQYVRSLYWAIVTMTTVGYGDITPHRNVEYLFSIVVMLLGASMYAFVIANVASLVSNLDAAKVRFRTRAEGVSLYLRSKQVPGEVSEQVHDYYEYLWARYRGMDEREMLSDLPPSLKLEVLIHLTKDLIEKVPLFHYCSPAVRNALLMELTPYVFTPGSIIVRDGEAGRGIFFLSSGSASIESVEGGVIAETFEAGDYFGHISLLLGEQRTASVRALSHCDVFVLGQDSFAALKNQYPEFREVLKKVSSEKSEKQSALVMDGVIL